MTITKRDLLATLSKPELLEIGRRFELEVTGKMTKDDLLDRVVAAERAELAKILPGLAYESLKATCKDLGLAPTGRYPFGLPHHGAHRGNCVTFSRDVAA